MYKTWADLNTRLMACKTEREVEQLMTYESHEDRRRPQYLKRIHSRLNKLRASRERKELQQLKAKS